MGLMLRPSLETTPTDKATNVMIWQVVEAAIQQSLRSSDRGMKARFIVILAWQAAKPWNDNHRCERSSF